MTARLTREKLRDMRLWTPEEDAILRAAAEEGKAQSAVAKSLGRRKGSVASRAARMGITFAGKTLADKPRKAKAGGQRLPKARLAPRFFEDHDPREDRSKAVTFLDMMDRHGVCKWHLRGQSGLRGLVCGHATVPERPYCSAHTIRSIDPTRGTRAERMADRAVPA